MTNRKGEEHLESKIIIRNYPADTTDQDLRIMFEKYGKIEDCKSAIFFHLNVPLYIHAVLLLLVFSPKDKETRKPRGFTFCQYRRREDANEAVKGMDKRVCWFCRTSVAVCTALVSCSACTVSVCVVCVCAIMLCSVVMIALQQFFSGVASSEPIIFHDLLTISCDLLAAIVDREPPTRQVYFSCVTSPQHPEGMNASTPVVSQADHS